MVRRGTNQPETENLGVRIGEEGELCQLPKPKRVTCEETAPALQEALVSSKMDWSSRQNSSKGGRLLGHREAPSGLEIACLIAPLTPDMNVFCWLSAGFGGLAGSGSACLAAGFGTDF